MATAEEQVMGLVHDRLACSGAAFTMLAALARRANCYAITWVDERTTDLHLHLAALRVPEDINMFYRHLGCEDNKTSKK